ncbi:cell division control protein 15 [Melanomma pulvis-pyrius CBS 109.77]|uniref:non-specific serine/threonine protein kinase n=1 Tax=Melanomma pulvis-pyrius CBS 109.77 TaxID=1314802 RepID=A0A6A6X784_9PLEO|nr:cell division control protein 15 [Melanomma pulvis-pyrius CBS 109.77]
MESARLQPPNVGTKIRAIEQAKEMEILVAERAKRSGDEPPPYDFFELIGKGAYGRVFKGLNRTTKGLVAIKIIDIDKVDYEEMTTKNLSETLKEINILQQVRDSKARPYVNIIEQAMSVHNELWIISEYASGGSVNTLMKPSMSLPNPGLEERFIIPIARELALGLKFIHEAGVLHRDLKCNNVLINEDGRVQLCDFGVSGTLEPEIAKRSTIVGTPYWMAPELQKEWVKDADPNSRVQPNEILYGSEVDIWAYGCTVFEMATGFPPFHRTVQWELPQTGIPQLEDDRFSDNLKDFVSFVLQANPQDRPTPDQMLEHPFLANTSKMYPTVTLVQLVERYYRWEQGGGARASLFNPYGAQAPDPLAPETEDDDDDDWTFSTTDEFEKQFAGQYADPFTGEVSGQGFAGMNAPPADDDRFAKLQASIREEQINRGKRGLGRLFDPNSTPYRYSGIESGGRPPSDLILRDFNPGAPNRETVIDLDLSLPTVADVPSIDLGEVPTLKAGRVNMTKLLREMELEDEEERDSFNQEAQLDKRATREWKFPSAPEQSNRRTVEWKFPTAPEPDKRATRDWKFPTTAEKPNRRTVEWTFDAAMAESNYAPLPTLPKGLRMSRQRDTQEISLMTPPLEENRQTRDFVFPPREDHGSSRSESSFDFSSSPTLGPGYQSGLRRSSTEPLEAFDDYPRLHSAPSSPTRNSTIEIDLDMAYVDDDFRPSTSGSASTSIYTAGAENPNGNPFDLEDQVQLSQTNNRASYHMKSQSEPNHAIPGLLTPQTYDEQGHPTNQDPHHPSMHARGVSSVSQMQAQAKQPPNNIMGTYYRGNNQRSQQVVWDGWNHTTAYGLSSDESPPTSVSTDASIEEEDVDYLWDSFERLTMQNQRRAYGQRSRRADSRDEDPRSDAEDNYADDDLPARSIRVSVDPSGKPLVDFPVPRGPDPESLLGVDADPVLLQNALWKCTTELRDGLRASRDLLKAMRLGEAKPSSGLEEVDEESEGGGTGTVRVNKP